MTSPRQVNFIKEGDGDPRHGTETGYFNHRCRCRRCRTVGSQILKANRATRIAKAKLGLISVPHGTQNGYSSYACRCAACKQANTTYYTTYWQNRKTAK